jgi:Co/Zn/Cd efflux system component
VTDQLDPLANEAVPAADAGDALLEPAGEAQAAALRFAGVASLVLAGFEALVGLMIGSVALLAIAIDSLRDAAQSGTVLLLGGRPRRLYRIAAVVVAVLAAFAFVFIVLIAFHTFGVGRVPNPWLMIAVALISFVVNVMTAWRLRVLRHTEDDVSWTWRQTRWDFAADLGVILAALAIVDFLHRWPDVAAGVIIAVLNLLGIVRLLRAMWRAEREVM